MQASKYIRLLRALNKSERTEFGKYIKALYGKKLKVLAIYHYIQKFAKNNFEHPKLERLYIRKKVFNSADYEGKGLSNLMSELNLYLEEFLRWKKINHKANNYEKDKLQLQVFREKKLEIPFVLYLEKTRKEELKRPLDMWRHQRLAEIASMLHYSFSTNKLTQKENTLSDFLNHLDNYHKQVHIKAACELKQRAEILSKEIETTEVKGKEETEFYIAYRYLLDLIEAKEGASFANLKAFALNKMEGFSREDGIIIINNLINYCIKKIKTGQIDFSSDMFDLYKFSLETKLLLLDGYISHTDFNNIVELACKREEFIWTTQFIEQYGRVILPEALRGDSENIARAILAFNQHNYEEVIYLLNEVGFGDTDHGVRARWLLLCSHLEHDAESTTFRNFCNAYEIFFKRNKVINQETINGSLNLLDFVKKMRMPFDKEKLREEVKKTKPLFYKYWLLKKIDPTLRGEVK